MDETSVEHKLERADKKNEMHAGFNRANHWFRPRILVLISDWPDDFLFLSHPTIGHFHIGCIISKRF